MVAEVVTTIAGDYPPDSRAVSGGPARRASLDHLETKAQRSSSALQVICPAEVQHGPTFRHTGWVRQRTAIRAALESVLVPLKRLQRWDACGSNVWVMRSEANPPVYKLHADCCRDRFCRPCGNARSRLLGDNLAAKLGSDRARLVTLTLRSANEQLADLIRLLYDSFRKLRRSALWKRAVTGGGAFLEVKYNAKLNRWHPHLHVIVQGKWIDQRLLSKLWESITATSWIVDVRLIRNKREAVNYVSKYTTKPLSGSFVDNPDRLAEAVVALSGTHLCFTFGSWRKWKLFQRPKDGPWHSVDTLVAVVRRAVAGSVADFGVLERLGYTVQVVVQQRAPPVDRESVDVPTLFDVIHDPGDVLHPDWE